MADQSEAQPETAAQLMAGWDALAAAATVAGFDVTDLSTALAAARAAGYREGAAEGAAQYRLQVEALPTYDDGGARSDSKRLNLGYVDRADVLRILAAPEAEAREPGISVEPDDPEYMCPNCVTPWKCNGPHIPARLATEPTAAQETGEAGR